MFLFCWAAFLSISLLASVFPVSLPLFFLFLRPCLIHARMPDWGRAFVHGHTFLRSWSGSMMVVVGLLHWANPFHYFFRPAIHYQACLSCMPHSVWQARLACQAAWHLMKIQLGLPDRRVSLMVVCRSSRHAWTGISHQLCLVGEYYVIYPFKFSLFTEIVFFNVFYAVKTDKHAWSVCVGFRVSGMPVQAYLSGMPQSVWPAIATCKSFLLQNILHHEWRCVIIL